MHAFRIISLLISIIFVVQWPDYCSAEQNQNELVSRLMKVSGLSAQIDQIHAAIWAAAPADAFASEAQGNEALRRFRKTFTTDRLMSLVRDQMLNSFDEDKIESLIKFHENPLGRKLARIQKDSLNSRNLKNMRESRKTAALLEGKRLDLISKIMELDQAAEINTQLAMEFVLAMLNPEALSDTQEIYPEASQDRRKTSVALEKSLVDETTILSYANNLKSFDESELAALASFLETPEADWFRKTSGASFRNAARELGKALAETLASRSN